MVLTQVYLIIVLFYISISIFNMRNMKRAFDEVYGATPLNFHRFMVLLKRVTILPVNVFIAEFWIGFRNFDRLVESVRQAKRYADMRRVRG